MAVGEVQTTIPARARPSRTALQNTQTQLAWLLMAPTILVILIVAAYPLGRTVYDSFTDAAFGSQAHLIGWANYDRLINDIQFRESVFETFKFTIITVVFEFILGMGIALIVNSNFPGRGAMRAAMLVPWAIITVVNAQMWKLMLDPGYGVFNDILEKLHVPGAPFSYNFDPNTALATVSIIDIWKTTPFVALLMLAGLQVIPGDLYEAAQVDGANAWQQFWRITLPLLRPAILVTLIFRTMDALRVFDVFYVLFGAAPCIPGNCKTSMAVYDKENIVDFASSPGSLGYGAAISVGIFIILAIIIAIYIKSIRVEQ